MREILSKAKTLADGRWVEGYYCRKAETTYCFAEDYADGPVPVHHYIIRDEMTDWGLPDELRLYEVDPGTVCLFTGSKDKDGRAVYEHDILMFGTDPGFPAEVVLEETDGCGWIFELDVAGEAEDGAEPDPAARLMPLPEGRIPRCVVVGNRFDKRERR